MVRSSIRQSKENYLSIDDLKREIHGQDYGTGSASNQYSSSSFDMMNTLMVSLYSFFNKICTKMNFQMFMIQQQIQEMSERRLTSHQQRFEHLLDDRSFKISKNFL